MKILIVGFGSIGRRHYQNLVRLGQSDITLLRSGKSTLTEALSISAPVVTSLEKALELEPDAAVIATPTSLHLEAAIPLARAGCHLLIEKPLSHNMERIPQLQDALSESGARLLVGFQFRFHSGLVYLKDRLEAGIIGRPLFVRAYWGEYLPDWHPWEDYRASYSARQDLGGGVVLTLCHPLDYLRWLLGEVDQVSAMVGKVSDLEIGVEDVAEIMLRFRSGCIAGVHLNYFRRPPVHSLEIQGSGGRLEWSAADGSVFLQPPDAAEAELLFQPELFERNDMFLAEMEHFLAVVAGEIEPACTLEDGVRALSISLSALESSTTGRTITFR